MISRPIFKWFFLLFAFGLWLYFRSVRSPSLLHFLVSLARILQMDAVRLANPPHWCGLGIGTRVVWLDCPVISLFGCVLMGSFFIGLGAGVTLSLLVSVSLSFRLLPLPTGARWSSSHIQPRLISAFARWKPVTQTRQPRWKDASLLSCWRVPLPNPCLTLGTFTTRSLM